MSRQDPRRLIQARINGGDPFADGLASGRELEELVEGVLWGNKIADETTATVEGIQSEVTRLEGLIVQAQGTTVTLDGAPQLTFAADNIFMNLPTKAPARTINNVAIANLQTILDSLPKYLDGDVTINTLAGTTTGTITVAAFTGNGNLNVIGASTAGAVTHNVNNAIIRGCINPRVQYRGFNHTNTTGNSIYVNECSSSFVYVYYCSASGGSGTDAANIGLYVNESRSGAYASSCNFSNKGRAYVSGNNSLLTLATPAGSGNNIIYRAQYGGQIAIRSAGTITGTTRIATIEASLVIDPTGIDASQIINLPATETLLWGNAVGVSSASITFNASGYRRVKIGYTAYTATLSNTTIQYFEIENNIARETEARILANATTGTGSNYIDSIFFKLTSTGANIQANTVSSTGSTLINSSTVIKEIWGVK